MIDPSVDTGVDDRLNFAVGTVVESEDSDNPGTVRVRYSWRGSNRESDQIRVVVPLATPEGGTYLLPQPGEEVFLAFEGGDINYPYVLGSVWNAEAEPPVESEERGDVLRIRSRTGHEVTLDDRDSETRIELVTNEGHRIVLDDASGKVSIEDNAGQRVVLDAAGDSVEIAANSTLTLRANSIELDGAAGVSISSRGEVSVAGKPIHLNKPGT
ncbi:hypothetical protein SAMN04487948_12921 [Halogranum amylolyticum]|uniref:Gp5/Type VI secretion system Vgr protein OB-fold domain-containing protein n=1 Tax=Halogranum amylolyticum TaxID=660520 RepID=A0A1H8WFZ0_9EURY|nr:phage baseplate assembly protein V [Halogranum amylolyticum]SEP26582.1 hypothetical protein SAMN04487948_12921 [Halogranum amylolyticum]